MFFFLSTEVSLDVVQIKAAHALRIVGQHDMNLPFRAPVLSPGVLDDSILQI